MSSVVSALSLIPAVTQAQDPPAEATLETTTASHSRAPRASRPSQSTSIIRHLVFLWRTVFWYFEAVMSWKYQLCLSILLWNLGSLLPYRFVLVWKICQWYQWGVSFLVLLYSCQFLRLCLLVCFMYLGVPILSSGKDWGHEEKGVTEDEMAGWHHMLHRHEFEQTQGESEGQGSLGCCSPWGWKELDTT